MTNEIVLYQPDESVQLEVRVQDESVWLSQQQMGELFGVNRQAVTKHLKNIYESNELEESATCSILELVHFDKHNAQYAPIEVEQFDRSHDRFLCIDNTVYHIGASLKDLGKKWFAFNRMEQTTDDLLSKM